MATPVVINAVLQERVNLVAGASGTDVYFSVPTVSQTVVPNALKVQPLEEVFITLNGALGELRIFLPSISDFYNYWNTKIYILGIDGKNTIYPYGGSESPVIPGNTLNGYNSLSVSPTESYFLHIVNPTMWIALNCPAAPAP